MKPSQDIARRRPPRGGRTFRKPTPERLANIALHYLARYAASEASLRRVLENRVRRAAMQDAAFAADEAAQKTLSLAITAIVEKHKSSGVIDDAAYAAMKTASLRRAGRSARAITQKLAAKGIKDSAALDALAAHEAEEGGEAQELKAAHAFARKKRLGAAYRRRPTGADGDESENGAGRLSRQEEAKIKNKEIAAMARAGFSMDTIRTVLSAEDAWEE